MSHSGEHKIHTSTVVDCPFSAVIEMLEKVLYGREVLMVSPLHGVRERVRVGWAIVDDVGDRTRRHDAIAIYWKPAHAMFPSFAGTITVRPHLRRSHLRISGNYTPPLGTTGELLDRIAGRYIAGVTLHRLIRDLAEAIESRYLVYLEEIGAARAHGHAGGERDQVLGAH